MLKRTSAAVFVIAAAIPHPELSTSSGQLVSFFNPAAAPYYNPSEPTSGHVMVAAFPG